jgi:NodT family efflux transporter outer membrane factor (OMF) lipoprotein
MLKNRIIASIGIGCLSLLYTACIPSLVKKEANKTVPTNYKSSSDTTVNTAMVPWKDFIADPYLIALIDTALKNNQQFNIITQEINIANYEVKSRKGKYLPFVNIFGGASLDKQGQYTRLGAVDNTTEIEPGKKIPTTLPDYLLAANVSWQVDIWKQLRNAKKSAFYTYLSTIEGKRFMQTNLIAEIAYAYYELLALDNQLEILQANIKIQTDALEIVTLQKTAGFVTELAVRRFQGEVRKNQSRQYYIQQRIIEAQNRINFLVGRYPQPTERNSKKFTELALDTVLPGIPSQLLENRPDVREAEMRLAANKMDVKVAKANFYPVFNIVAGIGYEAFDAKYFITTPQSMMYNLAGSLVTPFINRNAIKATYLSANAKQIQAAYYYERTILNAYTEVANQMAKIDNLAHSYNFKAQQVEALSRSIDISISLFKTARADYVEVLLTQRDALESKIELIETKKQQMNARVQMYQVLGGGWR